MTDETELENPLAPSVAEQAHIQTPPALIEAAKDDPEIIVQLARGQALIVQDRMVQKALMNPETSLGQLVAVHERLTKTAKIDQAQAPGAAAGQQIVVNFTFLGPKEEKLAIEGEATVVGGEGG